MCTDLISTVAGKNKTESQNLQHKHKLKTESQNLQHEHKTLQHKHKLKTESQNPQHYHKTLQHKHKLKQNHKIHNTNTKHYNINTNLSFLDVNNWKWHRNIFHSFLFFLSKGMRKQSNLKATMNFWKEKNLNWNYATLPPKTGFRG